MTNRYFQQKALKAYGEYMALQEMIDDIEVKAIRIYTTRELATYQLLHHAHFSDYRHFCTLRDMKMRVASLNAQMALMGEE